MKLNRPSTYILLVMIMMLMAFLFLSCSKDTERYGCVTGIPERVWGEPVYLGCFSYSEFLNKKWQHFTKLEFTENKNCDCESEQLMVFGNKYSKVSTKATDCTGVVMYEISASKTANDLVIVNWFSNNDTLYINSFGSSYRGEQVKARIVNNGKWNAEWRGGYFKNISIKQNENITRVNR